MRLILLAAILLSIGVIGCSGSDSSAGTPPETASTPPPKEPAGSTPDNVSGAANPDAAKGG